MLTNLLFFYLGGSFVVALYWLLDSLDGEKSKGPGAFVFILIWPIVFTIAVIAKKLEHYHGDKRG